MAGRGNIRRGLDAAAALLTHRPPTHVLYFDGGIGDELLCSAVARAIRDRDPRARVWMASERPELFAGNRDLVGTLPRSRRLLALLARMGAQVSYPAYPGRDPATDRSPDDGRHIIATMCRSVGLRDGPVTLRPNLALADAERAAGRRVDRQVAIMSTGLSAYLPMTTKEWYADRFAAVVASLAGEFDFVQLGSPKDPPLPGALDLRGKTTLRETAGVLAASRAFVGQVGFLMHLARAVDCRSAIVYGGREDPAKTGYPCNVNLFTPLTCSPCWLWSDCPYGRDCMRRITVEHVCDAVRRVAARHGEPIEVAEADLAAPPQISMPDPAAPAPKPLAAMNSGAA